jgi:acetyl esterase/lipase
MKPWIVWLCLLLSCMRVPAEASVWQPAAGRLQMPLWPDKVPDAQAMPGPETEALRTEHLIAGRPWMAVTNVSRPTLTIYAPTVKNTGAAVVVFPGGGFQVLAIDLEGTEICDWLTSRGITCVLLKYRVPSTPYDWRRRTYPDDFALSMPSLQDAQRTVRLVRFHAAEWHVDPHKIGVIGFSAGGFLVAETSTDFRRRLYPPVDAADRQSDRPDFAMAMYPGHISLDDGRLNPNLPVSRETPPTFLVQAEDDYTDGVRQSLVYYAALVKAGVPAELHLYAHGGHAFGLRRTDRPITHWTDLADTWMRTIGVLPH